MKLDFEYGLGTMQAELPDNTDVFISGETVKDPACIPEDQLEAAYLESLAHPIGMPTLTELAHKGTTVTIIVPDRVKGGEQPTSHRKLSIKYILKELYAAGVEKKDILFIISNGLHPRSKASDAKAIFGDELFNEFWHSGQIISHDSEDQEHMVYLGTTHRGDPVYMYKYVYECDIPILIEVNVAGEESKFGVSVEETLPLIEEIAKLPAIHVEGLMTIAPYVEDPDDYRPVFRKFQDLSVDIAAIIINIVRMAILSMGKTGDYEVAEEEGATLVRLGTGIFGERVYSKS